MTAQSHLHTGQVAGKEIDGGVSPLVAMMVTAMRPLASTMAVYRRRKITEIIFHPCSGKSQANDFRHMACRGHVLKHRG